MMMELEEIRVEYRLVDCRCANPEDIKDVIAEFETNGEFCNALWRAYEIGVDQWLVELETDSHEFVLAFYVGTELVGVARVTPKPNHEANGNVGYYIRPSCRGMRYGHVLLHMIVDFCKANNVQDVFAVTSVKNVASMKTLASAGWAPTGRAFKWKSKYGTRNAIEYSPESMTSACQKMR